jgi:hypothetical protein
MPNLPLRLSMPLLAEVQLTVTGGTASTTAMHGSTEEAQFVAMA